MLPRACLLLAFLLPAISADNGLSILQDFGNNANCDGHTCPVKHTLKPKPLPYTPTSNGCGTDFLKLDMTDFPLLENCCHRHDECYGTCQKSKEMCDKQFEKCLTRKCRGDYTNNPGCSSMVETMVTGVRMFGCGSYKSSQADACECIVDSDL